MTQVLDAVKNYKEKEIEQNQRKLPVLARFSGLVKKYGGTIDRVVAERVPVRL